MARKPKSAYARHETRMWIQNIIVPGIALVGSLALNDDIRHWCGRTWRNAEVKIENTFYRIFHKNK